MPRFLVPKGAAGHGPTLPQTHQAPLQILTNGALTEARWSNDVILPFNRVIRG